ncbi:MAG: Gfo/Idh/MocA family oxidoreductase, partial [Verrucomicrobiota bacterium]
MQLTRRKFISKTTAAVIVAGTMARGKVFGANNRIRVCTIGFNGQGRSHINDILEMKDAAEYVALCDVDSNVLERGAKVVESAQGKKPKLYKDAREVMADKNIDAITIATPNHWHSLLSLWGCQAGKDVYVEKPMSHNIYEGRQVVAAAAKYGKIVHHGTQSRCSPNGIRDMKLIHDGFIGKIVESRGYVYKNGNRGSIGHGKPGPVPENLDWNLWQGPAKEHEFLINV